MISGNGLKKFDFARQNLDGQAKCLAKNRKKHCRWYPTKIRVIFKGITFHFGLNER